MSLLTVYIFSKPHIFKLFNHDFDSHEDVTYNRHSIWYQAYYNNDYPYCTQSSLTRPDGEWIRASRILLPLSPFKAGEHIKYRYWVTVLQERCKLGSKTGLNWLH